MKTQKPYKCFLKNIMKLKDELPSVHSVDHKEDKLKCILEKYSSYGTYETILIDMVNEMKESGLIVNE